MRTESQQVLGSLPPQNRGPEVVPKLGVDPWLSGVHQHDLLNIVTTRCSFS